MKMQSLVVSFSLFISSLSVSINIEAAEIDLARVKELNKKYNVRLERPKSCPLESKSFADLVAKAEAVKDVFKGNCTAQEANKLDEILASIKELKESSKTGTAQSNETVNSIIESITGSTNLELNVLASQKMGSLFSNLSSVFKNNQCRMEDGKLLETAASLVLETTQIGLLVGNGTGIAIAGGGFLLASGLKLIQQLLKQKFDFEKTSDRQSFIKLNCSFYEIRRELEISGILDLENSYSQEDFRDSKVLAAELTTKIKDLEAQKRNIEKVNSDFDKEALEKNMAGIDTVKKALQKLMGHLKEGLKSDSELPTETQKLVMISKISSDYNSFVEAMKTYEGLSISSMPMMDSLFLQELAIFDYMNFATFQESMKLSAKEFNEEHRAKIIFHIMRIGADIEKVEADVIKNNSGAKKLAVSGLDQEIKELFNLLVELKKVEVRLGALLAPKQYTGLDDGSENMVALVTTHDQISKHLYGEWGYKFLKYATENSFGKTQIFNSRYKLFQEKYSKMGKEEEVDTRISYVCQDAQKLRLIYRQASSLTQQGYDFVATNKDIFYSDLKNKFNMKMNEDTAKANLFLSNEEKIQRHYMSAIYAMKKLNGEEVSEKVFNKYLSKKFLKSYYIGHSMLEVDAIKSDSKTIQDSFEFFNCQKSFGEDLVN